MATLVAAPAASAVCDHHIEAPADRIQLGQLLLVLVGDSIEPDLPAALTAVGRRGLEDLIDLLRDGPVRPPSVGGPGLSSSSPGIAFALLARERRGLALRLAPQLFDLALELCDPGPLALPLAAQRLVLGLELVVSGYEGASSSSRERARWSPSSRAGRAIGAHLHRG